MLHVHQLNLQQAAGGGEVYTRWFTRALVKAGARVSLYVAAENRFWDGLDSANIDVIRVRNPSDISRRFPDRGAWIVTQSRIPKSIFDLVAQKHVLTGFSHMPIHSRSAVEFSRYEVVFTVSEYCIGLLRASGISKVFPVPLYGTYELDRPQLRACDHPIVAKSPYHWDRRKGRDRLLSIFEPLNLYFGKRPVFARKPGLTLGVVSLLSPIKQFPALFSLLAPYIAAVPEVNLEIFGNGGYAQVRDLRKALKPISSRVRFWGYQEQVGTVYPQIDYLMTGLPEKEALGLNALEAQALGTPVLAPRAGPFIETIRDKKGGFLYCDPREDGGNEFKNILASLVAGRERPDPRSDTNHLATFSFAAMVDRTRNLVQYMSQAFPAVRDR